MYSDLTWWLYLGTTVVALYGSILFGYWAVKNKFRTSSVFSYTWIWLMGTALSSAINIRGRTLALEDPDLFLQFSLTFWWPMRKVAILLILIVFMSHMTRRLFIDPPDHDRRIND